MCDNLEDSCAKLEAEPIVNNEDLLDFRVRSSNVEWGTLVTRRARRTAPFYLQRQFNLVSNYREPIGNHNRRRVIVCHDMMGNYLEDKHYQSSKKYDDYRFYHWAAVDYFCYFSHHYITIPPSGWINAAHKHGVGVLGTFIAEHKKGSDLLHEILVSKEQVNKVVLAMIRLCQHFKFDGWLMNIECKVNPEAIENLTYFLHELRESAKGELECGAVFWYDSLIKEGDVLWQNEINDNNVEFFKESSGILVNYAWKDHNLEVTRNRCEQERQPFQNVFFGLDVFGRQQPGKFQSKQTLAHIVKFRFSTFFFAPGWTFETLQQFGYDIKDPLGNDRTNEAFLRRNEKFWWLLWEHLPTHPYCVFPFYTDFCLGSGKETYKFGLPKSSLPSASYEPSPSETGPFFSLLRQSLQPSVPLHNLALRHYEDAFNGGSCLHIKQHDQSFRIFATDFKVSKFGVVCAYAYKLDPRDGQFECILRICTVNNARDCHIFLGDYNHVEINKGRCNIPVYNPRHNHLLLQNMHCEHIPKNLENMKCGSNGWRVRYYVLKFDTKIQIKDVGVLYRKSENARDSPYLGAFYINEFDANKHDDFTRDSKIGLIPLTRYDILNDVGEESNELKKRKI